MVYLSISKADFIAVVYIVLKKGKPLYVNKNTLWKDYYDLLLLHMGEDCVYNTVTVV